MTDDNVSELAPVRAPLEFRNAEVVDVRFPDRVVEVVAMPYGEPALVAHNGRMITEVCERGAFNGVEKRANRIRVNRDHDVVKTVGRAIALHPSRQVGLVAELRISKTQLGEETLELASDGALDASVGFAPFPDGESWSRDRRQRSLTKCWLGHIALVPEPAYEGAQVLAVRAHPAMPGFQSFVGATSTGTLTVVPPRIMEPPPTSATPNLDKVLALRARERYGFTNQ